MVEAELIDHDDSDTGLGPEDAREALAEFDERVRTFVAEHPVASVVGALTAGYFVGRLLR